MQLVRHLLRQVVCLTPVFRGVVELPHVIVERRRFFADEQPRRLVPRHGSPSVVVNAAVAEHLEVLGLVPLGVLLIVARIAIRAAPEQQDYGQLEASTITVDRRFLGENFGMFPRSAAEGLLRPRNAVRAPCGRSEFVFLRIHSRGPPLRGVPRGARQESIYRRYAIVDKAMQREAAARLDAWMAAPPAAPSTATVTALRRGSRLRGRVTG